MLLVEQGKKALTDVQTRISTRKFGVILLPMQEVKIQSLGWEDPLEKEIATHSSTLAWGIPWTEEAGWRAAVRGVTKGSDKT